MSVEEAKGAVEREVMYLVIDSGRQGVAAPFPDSKMRPLQCEIDRLILEVTASLPCYFSDEVLCGDVIPGNPLCPSCAARKELAAMKVEAR